MNTREIAVEFRLSHWAKIVQDRNDSGLSINAYCKEIGIHENSYYYWLKKLREAACEGMNGLQCKTASLAPAGFTEVKLSAPMALPAADATQQDHICIEAAGVRITASSGYPIGNLTALMREVARPC